MVAINNSSETKTINLPEWGRETYAIYGVMEGVSDLTTIELPANEWFIISTL